MTPNEMPIRIAILDDYQRAALTVADWSSLRQKTSIEVFSDTITNADKLVARLEPFDVLCVMRERTPLPRAILERLPRLKLIVSTGAKNASIDQDAAKEHGITVENTHGGISAPIELTWALIMASARNIVAEANSLRAGGWQRTVGDELKGKMLGVLGLGRIGSKISRIARVFDMEVITWSDRVTQEEADQAGAVIVQKDELFRRADVLSIHLVLADSTRGLVGLRELALMKPTAWLVNTSRGQIVDEGSLVGALKEKKLGGAALDVFNVEPLPVEHPFRTFDNVLATPHLGYVSRQQYEVFYGDAVRAISAWLNTPSQNSPIPSALATERPEPMSKGTP